MDRRRFLATAAAVGALAPRVVTAAASQPLLRFGLITDAQFADAEAQGERHYRATPAKLEQAVAALAKEGLPFTLHLGDFIDHDFKSFDVLMPIVAGLGHPLRHVLGNHDYQVADADKCRVVAKLDLPHDYYTFRSSGVRFLMTDTNSLSAYKFPKGSPAGEAAAAMLKDLAARGNPAAKPWNGGVSEAQLAWLDRELSAADLAGERVIACGHHPLLPADSNQAWNNDAVLALLEKHPSVVAWFNGHNHAGAYEMRKGIHYVTFRALLNRPETTAWSIVSVFADRLVIDGHGREESRVLALRAG